MSEATVSTSVYDFKLILVGLDDLTSDITEKLYEAGLDDATLCARKGVVTAGFDREAESFEHAVMSAMDDIRKADVGVIGFRLDRQDDAVSLAEVARRIGKSRQAVSAYVARGKGGTFFPAPIIDNSGEALYSWADVADWLRMNGMLPEELAREADSRKLFRDSLETLAGRQRRIAALRAIEEFLGPDDLNGRAEFNARSQPCLSVDYVYRRESHPSSTRWHLRPLFNPATLTLRKPGFIEQEGDEDRSRIMFAVPCSPTGEFEEATLNYYEELADNRFRETHPGHELA